MTVSLERASRTLKFFLIVCLAVFVACNERRQIPVKPKSFDVVETTISRIQNAITSGQATCRDIVQAHLDRIAAYDKPTGLNAITVVNPRALQRAEKRAKWLALADCRVDLICALERPRVHNRDRIEACRLVIRRDAVKVCLHDIATCRLARY